MKFDAVQAWIDNVAYSHSKSVSTEREYKYYLKMFCDFIGKTPQQILEEYEKTDERQFRRKYAQYVRAYISQINKSGYAPCTVRSRVGVVKSFFKYNDLPLGYVPVGKFKIKFHNRDITKEEIISVLEASRPRDKAFFCMMAQTGIRPDTLCSLRVKHVEPEFSKGIVPCKIEVPEEMAKGEFGAYFTFMGEESVKYLKAYLAIRPGIGSQDYLFSAHGLDKKANPKSMSKIFAKTLQKLEKKGILTIQNRQFGKPAEVRLYNLRKFFRKQAGKAGVEYVNFWMGHKTNYKAPYIPASDVHYFSREDVESQRTLYKEKAMPFLRLETATPSETEQIVAKQTEEIERLKNRIIELERERKEYKLTESQVGALLKRIEALEKLARAAQ